MADDTLACEDLTRNHSLSCSYIPMGRRKSMSLGILKSLFFLLRNMLSQFVPGVLGRYEGAGSSAEVLALISLETVNANACKNQTAVTLSQKEIWF